MPERDLYRGLVHPLLAVAAPTAFLVPFCALASDLVFGLLPGWPVVLPLCLATGGLGALLGNFLHSEHARPVARLREAALIALLVYLGASLAGAATGWNGPIAGDWLDRLRLLFQPTLPSAWLTGIAIAQWTFTAIFQHGLRARELFLEQVEGFSGPALQSAVRDAGDLSEEALTGLQKIGGLTATFSLVLALFWLVLALVGLPARLSTLLAAIPGFLVRPFIRALIAQYGLEHETAGEGLRIDPALRRTRLRAAGLIIAAAALVAVLLSADTTFLPLAWLAALINWLFSWMRPNGVMEMPEVLAPSRDTMAETLAEMTERIDIKPWIDWNAIFAVLRPILLTAAIGAALWFLAAPLFSRYVRGRLRSLRIGRFLAAKWRQLSAWLGRKRRPAAAPVRLGDADLAPLRRALADIARRRASREKRREVGRMTRLYLRIVAWGAARGHPYRQAAAPGEYSRSLAAAFPGLAADWRLAGEIFEEALYSDRLIGQTRQRDYLAAVQTILREPVVGGTDTPV